ncbi:hypothetical protein N8I77_010379 [Diaporthe amygdali]|uniref:DUF8035 domain-containing protein n=1 Tax=Phomopsis amygdali TaxID=1214568 RepID=A0AAD9S723_PHOAM|nr:hypothetical protein N8I77_010379 [Diaporthe amygdali]
MPETYRRYEERDTYYDDEPPRRRPPPPREEEVYYERREERRSRTPPPPMARRSDVQVAVREEVERESRVPHFMREESRRPPEAGPLVLRQRDVETVERARPRPRSPSPIVRERIVTKTRARSVSPGPPPPPPPPEIREREEIRTRIVDHSRERVRSPSRGPAMDRVRLGTRIIERPDRSPSPPPVMERTRTRVIERERSPSPRPLPPPELERSRLRIIERERERAPTPSPSPSPPPPEPQVIRGPTIEREVITHYRDIDHGLVVARPPSPPPPPRRVEKRETDIDIYTSRNETEIDITKTRSQSRSRARSVSRERPRVSYDPPPPRDHSYYHEDDIMISSGRDKLKVDIEHERRSSSARPRSHSAAPGYDDEADLIRGRIDSRGRMGEAWGGATKDWVVVDVPPGTERVRMDGVGGGAAEVTWQRYNGARRAKFIPERASESALVPLSPPASSSTTVISDRDTYAPPRGDRERDRLSVQIYDKERERDVEVEKVTDRRISLRPTPPPPAPMPKTRDMWTEVTKDLVVREAIEEIGYDYEETEQFFYVMQYLKYEDVLELVEISDRIRARRKDRIREIQFEREVRDDWERDRRHHRHRPRWEDERERVVEREVVFYRQNTLLPIIRLAKSIEDEDFADSMSQRLRQWQTRKLDEYRFVQLSGSLLAAAVIGSFSWPIPDTIHWLGPASWYASLIMSFCAVLLSSSEHFLYAATRDHAQHSDLRRRLNMVLKINGGSPGDLLLPTTPPPSPAQPRPVAQSASNAQTPAAARLQTNKPPVRARVRWNMVFTWQAPMMLLSYSLIAFVVGLTICVLTPLYDGRDYDDACKVAILYIVFSMFAGSTFVWCSFWEYTFIDLDDL